MDVPGLFWPYLVVAAACGHLGRRAEAEAAVRDLLALDPNSRRTRARRWDLAIPSGLMDPIPQSWESGTLDSRGADGSASRAWPGVFVGRGLGAVRADEGFWVAVMPFKYAGADASLTALAEGLTEEIVTGLSRFSYLR